MARRVPEQNQARCERCGKGFEMSDSIKFIKAQLYLAYERRDLCEPCFEAVLLYIDGYPKMAERQYIA